MRPTVLSGFVFDALFGWLCVYTCVCLCALLETGAQPYYWLNLWAWICGSLASVRLQDSAAP